nr:immunoglobulin heavy chain junction region [Mus musculus]
CARSCPLDSSGHFDYW